MLRVEWKGGMAFEANPPSGASFVMDTYPESGGTNSGPTPVETLVSALAGCTAMDVISILQKKRQEVQGYRLEVEWDRGPEGEWPRPVTAVRIRHVLSGVDLDPVAVARAIELSDTKYCSVSATLRPGVAISTEFKIEG